MSLVTQVSEAQRVYKDILNGYSVISYKDAPIYIKHLRDIDHGEIQEYRLKLEKEAKDKGLLSLEDKLKILDESGTWTKEEEQDYNKKLDNIQNLKLSRSKLLLKSQKAEYDQIIEKKEEELQPIGDERNEYIGITSESFSEKRINERYLFFTFYKEPELKTPYFTEEEFEEIDDFELMALVVINNQALQRFSVKEMGKVSVCTFFINSIMICDSNPYFFFGKPIVELTNYQADLFYKGLTNKKVLEEGKNPPQTRDLEELYNWYDASSGSKLIDQSNKEGSTIIGASKEEMEQMVTSSADDKRNVVNFNDAANKMAKDKGTTKLSMQDIIKIHGQ